MLSVADFSSVHVANHFSLFLFAFHASWIIWSPGALIQWTNQWRRQHLNITTSSIGHHFRSVFHFSKLFLGSQWEIIYTFAIHPQYFSSKRCTDYGDHHLIYCRVTVCMHCMYMWSLLLMMMRRRFLNISPLVFQCHYVRCYNVHSHESTMFTWAIGAWNET